MSDATAGLTLLSLATELGLPETCPECHARGLRRVYWQGSTPVELEYACGHVSLPLHRGGRHRLRA